MDTMLGFIELNHDMLLGNKEGSNNPYASNFAFMKISCCNHVFRYTLSVFSYVQSMYV
ncbi:unnamed protein product [Camellia sinensis]